MSGLNLNLNTSNDSSRRALSARDSLASAKSPHSNLGGENTARVGAYRLVTPRSSRGNVDSAAGATPGDASQRHSTRVRRAATAAGTKFDLATILQTFIKINTEQNTTTDNTNTNNNNNNNNNESEKLNQALQEAVDSLQKYSRLNFNKVEVQIAHVCVASAYYASLIANALEQVPKVQSSLVNVSTVMCIGGGPCDDSLGVMAYLLAKEKERQLAFTKLVFRVIDPEPQWQQTWEPTFEASSFNHVEFEQRDYDGMHIEDIEDWELSKPELFTFSFLSKPIFKAMWAETTNVMMEIIANAKEGAFFVWVNHLDAVVNRYFERWMGPENMLLQFAFDGKASDFVKTPYPLPPLSLPETAQNTPTTTIPPNHEIFVRIFRKAKTGISLPHIEKSAVMMESSKKSLGRVSLKTNEPELSDDSSESESSDDGK